MWSSIWVEHDSDAREAWHNLFQDLQPVARHEGIEAAEARYVAAWIRKARDQAIAKRIGDAHENDGIAWVACFSARAGGVLEPTITSGARLTSSAAFALTAAAAPVPQRMSTRMLLPSAPLQVLEALAERRDTCLSLRVILCEPHQNPDAPRLLSTCSQ